LESLQQNPGPPIYKLPPEQARAVLSSLQASHVEKLPAEIENRIIPGGPTDEISIQIIRPLNSDKKNFTCCDVFPWWWMGPWRCRYS
jgi:hypothetical protein